VSSLKVTRLTPEGEVKKEKRRAPPEVEARRHSSAAAAALLPYKRILRTFTSVAKEKRRQIVLMICRQVAPLVDLKLFTSPFRERAPSLCGRKCARRAI